MAKTVIPTDILAYARELRAHATGAETYLWQLLRDRRLLGFKFRRQHPLGRFIVDFYCEQARLVIELDGSQHLDNKDYDRKRTEWLEEQGMRVLRFWDNDMLSKPEEVLEEVVYNLTHD
ncbi:MAG: DUF559 domain-containing protein [Anaerolineaceae bacterium]